MIGHSDDQLQLQCDPAGLPPGHRHCSGISSSAYICVFVYKDESRANVRNEELLGNSRNGKHVLLTNFLFTLYTLQTYSSSFI